MMRCSIHFFFGCRFFSFFFSCRSAVVARALNGSVATTSWPVWSFVALGAERLFLRMLLMFRGRMEAYRYKQAAGDQEGKHAADQQKIRDAQTTAACFRGLRTSECRVRSRRCQLVSQDFARFWVYTCI